MSLDVSSRYIKSAKSPKRKSVMKPKRKPEPWRCRLDELMLDRLMGSFSELKLATICNMS